MDWIEWLFGQIVKYLFPGRAILHIAILDVIHLFVLGVGGRHAVLDAATDDLLEVTLDLRVSRVNQTQVTQYLNR